MSCNVRAAIHDTFLPLQTEKMENFRTRSTLTHSPTCIIQSGEKTPEKFEIFAQRMRNCEQLVSNWGVNAVNLSATMSETYQIFYRFSFHGTGSSDSSATWDISPLLPFIHFVFKCCIVSFNEEKNFSFRSKCCRRICWATIWKRFTSFPRHRFTFSTFKLRTIRVVWEISLHRVSMMINNVNNFSQAQSFWTNLCIW